MKLNLGISLAAFLTIHKLSLFQATEVLQSAGVTSPNMTPAWENVHYCNVTLPARKPYASRDSPLAERLFIVSSPNRFDESVLEDTMCRFGNFISAYFMPGEACLLFFFFFFFV